MEGGKSGASVSAEGLAVMAPLRPATLPGTLLAAALRYLREDPDMKRYGFPQGLANWLADEKFEAWAEPMAALVRSTSSCIPKSLLDAAMPRKGEAWVASWIFPCRYDAVARVLYAETAFAARTIASELESLLRNSLGYEPTGISYPISRRCCLFRHRQLREGGDAYQTWRSIFSSSDAGVFTATQYR